MEPGDYISVISVGFALFSYLASRKSVKEAKKANDIGRMNALLALQMHYKDRIRHQHANFDSMKNDDGKVPESFGQSVRNEVGMLQDRSREVEAAIKKMHEKVV